MKNLPKDKRDKMILVAIVSAVGIAAVWMLLVSPLRSSIKEKREKLAVAEQELTKAERLATRGDEIEAEVAALTEKLASIENQMANGDLYSWIIRTMTIVQGNHNVTIPTYNPPTVGAVDMFADFPYQGATYAFRGFGHFHEIGKLVADLENRFPFARILNLELDSAGISTATSGDEAEKIGFRFDFVTLVKPNNAL